MLRLHVVVQQLLRPGETRAVEVSLAAGDYLVFSQARGAGATGVLHVSAVGCTREALLRVHFDAIDAAPSTIAPGGAHLALKNETDADALVRFEQRLDQTDRAPAVVAMTHPAFRTLLSPQLLAYGEHFSASNMAFLFVDLADRGRFVELYGEASALASLRAIEETLTLAVERASGAIFEASFGRWIAAFATASQALEAALGWEREHGRDDGAPRPRIAVSAGRSIAFTHGTRITYFGETIERGLAYLEASRGAVVLGSGVAEQRECAKSIHDGRWSIRVTTLPGDTRRERLHLVSPR